MKHFGNTAKRYEKLVSRYEGLGLKQPQAKKLANAVVAKKSTYGMRRGFGLKIKNKK